MKPSEKRMLIITLLVVAGALAFTFLGGEPEEGPAAAAPATGNVAAEQRTFKRNMAIMRQAREIAADYDQIDLGVAESTSRRPETELSNQLFQLLTERLKVANPRMATPTFSQIPEVTDYCFVDIAVDIQGPYPEIVNLMKEMDSLGLLIKSFKIGQRNRGAGELVDLSITVSRLVKVDANIERRLKAARS